MSNIPNIRTEGSSGLNTGSSDSSDNLASADTKNQNSKDFENLEALRNKITSHNPVTNDGRA